jgi:hypothetical protein
MRKLYGASKLYQAKQAMLRVVGPQGVITTAAIPANRGGTTAAALLGIARVNDGSGKEIFLKIQQISSGATAVAYGLHDDHLIPAGAVVSYGGDSGAASGFDCFAGPPARMIQRSFLLTGPTIHGFTKANGVWKETELTYVWHGSRLVKIAQSTVKLHGIPPASETTVGAGCIKGVA